jgi:hypothetical protein
MLAVDDDEKIGQALIKFLESPPGRASLKKEMGNLGRLGARICDHLQVAKPNSVPAEKDIIPVEGREKPDVRAFDSKVLAIWLTNRDVEGDLVPLARFAAGLGLIYKDLALELAAVFVESGIIHEALPR